MYRTASEWVCMRACARDDDDDDDGGGGGGD